MLKVIVVVFCIIFNYINLPTAVSLLSVINYFTILNQMEIYILLFSLDIIGHFNDADWQRFNYEIAKVYFSTLVVSFKVIWCLRISKIKANKEAFKLR